MGYTKVAVWLDPGTIVKVTDDAPEQPDFPGPATARIVCISWDDITVHVGGDTDEERVAALSLLSAAVAEALSGARLRLLDKRREAVVHDEENMKAAAWGR